MVDKKVTDKKKENRSGFNIFYKLLLTMLIVAMIPLSGVWYITHYKAVDDWNTNIDRQLSQVVSALVRQVNIWSDLNVKVLLEHASLPAIVSMDPAQQKPVLEVLDRTYDWTYLAYTMDPDGINIARSDDADLKDYSDREYYREAVRGDALGQQVILGRTSGKPSLAMAVPIRDDARRLVGVMALAGTLEEISKDIADIRLGRTGFAFLLDESGRVIAHQNPEFHNTLQDFSANQAFQQVPESGSLQVRYREDGRDLIAYSQKTDMGWTVVVQQDYQEAFAAVREADRDALVLLFITVVLVGTIAYVLSERLARPILNLTNIADGMSRGKLDVKISETERGDEIGALARAIERMGVSIQLAIERLRKRA